MIRRLSYAVLASGGLLLSGCFDPPPRTPLPPELRSTAHVPGYGLIRFWGDVYTQDFDTWLTDKNKAVAAAVAAGDKQLSDSKAEFLSISGGGDKGAFAAGFMKGWTESGKRPVFEAVSGVSAGALVAPFAFLGSDYDAVLQEIYTNTGPQGLFKSRGILGYFGDALNSTAPLGAMIKHYATDEFLDRIAAQYKTGRRLFVLTTNLDAQRPVIWDLSAIAASGQPDRRELLTKLLLASAAVPGLFPPVSIDVVARNGKTYQELYADGGVTSQLIFVPPQVNILKVEDKIFKMRRDRTLYIIENDDIAPQDATVEEKILPLVNRAVETLVKNQVVANLRELHRVAASNNTHFKFQSIPPSFTAVAPKPFDQTYSRELYKVGYQSGLSGAWIDTPPFSPELTINPNEAGPTPMTAK